VWVSIWKPDGSTIGTDRGDGSLMWQWSICTVILLFLYQASLYRGEVLVVQADTDVAFYVNGVETFPDTSSPVLPMNGVRRINMGDTNVRIYRISRDLAVGDLMAMQVNSRLASVINVTDALGRTWSIQPMWASSWWPRRVP